MKNKYRFRIIATLWFERYLTLCGAILNGLFIFGVIALCVPDGEEARQRKFARARAELEYAPMCDKLMGNAPFKPGEEFDLLLSDGKPMRLRYDDKGVSSRDKSGYAIHMVEMKSVGFLFFEIDEHGMIRRCIPERMLECVQAEGTFDETGDCFLTVNLPSDCELMKGTLMEHNRCRVPKGSRVLKPNKQAAGKSCTKPGCAS